MDTVKGASEGSEVKGGSVPTSALVSGFDAILLISMGNDEEGVTNILTGLTLSRAKQSQTMLFAGREATFGSVLEEIEYT